MPRALFNQENSQHMEPKPLENCHSKENKAYHSPMPNFNPNPISPNESVSRTERQRRKRQKVMPTLIQTLPGSVARQNSNAGGGSGGNGSSSHMMTLRSGRTIASPGSSGKNRPSANKRAARASPIQQMVIPEDATMLGESPDVAQPSQKTVLAEGSLELHSRLGDDGRGLQLLEQLHSRTEHAQSEISQLRGEMCPEEFLSFGGFGGKRGEDDDDEGEGEGDVVEDEEISIDLGAPREAPEWKIIEDESYRLFHRMFKPGDKVVIRCVFTSKKWNDCVGTAIGPNDRADRVVLDIGQDRDGNVVGEKSLWPGTLRLLPQGETTDARQLEQAKNFGRPCQFYIMATGAVTPLAVSGWSQLGPGARVRAILYTALVCELTRNHVELSTADGCLAFDLMTNLLTNALDVPRKKSFLATQLSV